MCSEELLCLLKISFHSDVVLFSSRSYSGRWDMMALILLLYCSSGTHHLQRLKLASSTIWPGWGPCFLQSCSVLSWELFWGKGCHLPVLLECFYFKTKKGGNFESRCLWRKNEGLCSIGILPFETNDDLTYKNVVIVHHGLKHGSFLSDECFYQIVKEIYSSCDFLLNLGQ